MRAVSLLLERTLVFRYPRFLRLVASHVMLTHSRALTCVVFLLAFFQDPSLIDISVSKTFCLLYSTL